MHENFTPGLKKFQFYIGRDIMIPPKWCSTNPLLLMMVLSMMTIMNICCYDFCYLE